MMVLSLAVLLTVLLQPSLAGVGWSAYGDIRTGNWNATQVVSLCLVVPCLAAHLSLSATISPMTILFPQLSPAASESWASIHTSQTTSPRISLSPTLPAAIWASLSTHLMIQSSLICPSIISRLEPIPISLMCKLRVLCF